jgi:hypothetical protein
LAGAPVLQRDVLPGARGAIRMMAADARPAIVAVRQALLAHAAVSEVDLQRPAQVRALGNLDRAIYAVIGAAPRTQLVEAPYGTHLLELLDQSEAEHARVVDAMRRRGGRDVPIDLGRLPLQVRPHAVEVWHRLSSGEGGLRVEGPGSYTRMIFGQLARLLDTVSGVELLNRLVTGAAGRWSTRVTIAPTIPSRLDPERAPTDSSYAVAAHPSRAVDFDAQAVASPAYRHINGPSGILEALDHGHPGFVLGGQAYAFSRGSDAVVVIRPHEHSRPRGPALSGVDASAILNPGWVTLGHELGHATKIAAGAHTPSDLASFAALPDTHRTIWGRAEEFVNIESVENPLRVQGGLPPRLGHRGQPSVVTLERRELLREDRRRVLAATGMTLDALMATPQGPRIHDLIQTTSPSLLMQNVRFERLRSALATLLHDASQ